MQDFKISIPRPCHENWDKMTPNEQGRHCNVCVKTVVDFTNMEAREIKSFFEEKKGEKVCGHFNTTQVDKTIPTFYQKLNNIRRSIEEKISIVFLKRIALLGIGTIMIVTGCSRHNKMMGAPVYSNNNNYDNLRASVDSPTVEEKQHRVITGDTVINVLKGEAEMKEIKVRGKVKTK